VGDVGAVGYRPSVMRRLLLMILTALALAPASALAVDPEESVSPGSSWFSGGLIQQPGTNCATAILGEPYPEIMVSGIGSYGGATGGGLVRVNQGYYTSILVGIPGNPCGSGVSAVATDVFLPPGTSADTSRPIRCFGQSITATTFTELTGGQWNHLGYSGAYCPTQASPSVYINGGVSVGFRPLASGQLFQVFLPVKTSQTLGGISSGHSFDWYTTATGVYENPGLSKVWANVFPATNAEKDPFVYFDRQPAAQPFWKADAPVTPDDTRNRVEFWANFYTAGKGGTLSFAVTRRDVAQPPIFTDANTSGTFNPVVLPGNDLIQIVATGDARGPNGGYAPLGLNDPPNEWNKPMRITWTFDPHRHGPRQ
jgi:hypothetical protein